MLSKSQNANESFNGTIWECIPKNTFVTLPYLEFGICDDEAHCNIRMKASVLIYEKLNFVPVIYMLKEFEKQFKKGQCSKPASESEKQTKTTNLAG